MYRIQLVLGILCVFLVASCGEVKTTAEPESWSTQINPFAETLISINRAGEIPETSDIYAGLLGSWDVDVIDYTEDGDTVRSRGEWHFARVLEGRAIQDVWIAPPRSVRRNAGTAHNRYGSSLRFYQPSDDTWKIIWINPVTGVENHLVGHRENGDIIHLGQQPNGDLYRWTFTDLMPDSFTWRGESSGDDGKSWKLTAEFFGRRQN